MSNIVSLLEEASKDKAFYEDGYEKTVLYSTPNYFTIKTSDGRWIIESNDYISDFGYLNSGKVKFNAIAEIVSGDKDSDYRNWRMHFSGDYMESDGKFRMSFTDGEKGSLAQWEKTVSGIYISYRLKFSGNHHLLFSEDGSTVYETDIKIER